MIKRQELIGQMLAGPLPPFIRDLRDAIRADKKTQTRRVMQPQPYQDENGHWFFGMEGFGSDAVPDYMLHYCKYGQVGQVRYLREPIYRGPDDFAYYADDDELVVSSVTGHLVPWRWKVKTLSQLYLPKELARTFVRLDAIRGERLWAISEDDCKAEGVVAWHNTINGTVYKPEFKLLWAKINASRGFGWDVRNWWVWVLGFSHYGGE